MQRIKLAILAVTVIAMPAQAALIADFQLNGNTTNAVGGPLLLTNNGTLGGTGISFAPNGGPTITGFSNLAVYSIEVIFNLDALGGYQKILDFKARSSDLGLYALGSSLNFYNFATGPAVFSDGTPATVLLTRDATGLTSGYVNGVQQFSYNDFSDSIVDSELHLFRDDFATSQGEAGPGFVNSIRIFDTVIAAGSVPEPSAWAMLIAGFGLVGGVLRRRAPAVA
jgi:hypothetical protein